MTAARRLVGYARRGKHRDQRRPIETPIHGRLDGIAVRLLNVSHGGIKVSIEDADADVTRWVVTQRVAGHTATLRQS